MAKRLDRKLIFCFFTILVFLILAGVSSFRSSVKDISVIQHATEVIQTTLDLFPDKIKAFGIESILSKIKTTLGMKLIPFQKPDFVKYGSQLVFRHRYNLYLDTQSKNTRFIVRFALS